MGFLQSKLKFYQQTLNNDESSYPDKYDDLMITFLIGKYMASLWIFFSWMKGFEIFAIAPYAGKILLRIGFVLASQGVMVFTMSFLAMLIPLAQLYHINFGTAIAEFSNVYNAYR